MLVLVLLLLPFDLMISLPGMLHKGISMSAPEVLEKGAAAVLSLTTTHIKPYPVRCIKVKIYVKGDDFSTVCRVRCGAERDSRKEMAIDTSHSGITVFEVKRIWTISLIGLFSLPLNAQHRTSVLILPPPVKPANTVALPRGLLLRPKPGGGYSEDHDMRLYRQGDPIRSIHWKLSAKYDSLIIREPLVPPPHSRLIRIMPWRGANDRDTILGRLRWVSDYLLHWEMPFYVRFDVDGPVAEVKRESDLTDYLRCVLDTMAQKPVTPVGIPARFTWVFQVDSKTDRRAYAKADRSADVKADAGEVVK